MKRCWAGMLLIALLLALLAVPAGAEVTAFAERGTAASAVTVTEKASAKTVTLKRGKTLRLWVYPFASTTQFYKDNGRETPVKSIQFSGTSGTVKAKVTSGGSWLKAKKTSSGWNFYVTGKNLTLKDKNGTIRITDGQGAFATIRVTRGGTVRYDSIYSRGTSIYASLNTSQDHLNMYVYRWVFDASGKLVSKTKLMLYGDSFRDTARSTHLNYTYVYTVGYYAEATGKGMQTGAAAVYLSDPMANTGKVKKATKPENCVTASWLYGIIH